MSREERNTGVKLTADNILAYRDKLNDMNFSRAMGWLWTVTRKEHVDGSSVVMLNRVDRPVKDGSDRPAQSSFGGVGDRIETEGARRG